MDTLHKLKHFFTIALVFLVVCGSFAFMVAPHDDIIHSIALAIVMVLFLMLAVKSLISTQE